MIQVLGLWNPDHLSGQSTLTSSFGFTFTGLYDGPTSNYGLFSSSGLSTYSWNVVSYLGRRWLRVNKTSASSTSAFMTVAPSVTGYTDLKNKYPNAKRVYQTIRVFVAAARAGGNLLCDGASGSYFGVASSNEYFVEVVTNLETNTRIIYVNGNNVTGAFPTTSWVGVGDRNGSMMSAANHGFYFTDYVFAFSDDATPPTRLGKLSVKTLLGGSTTNDEKFTTVGSGSSIAGILASGRTAAAPSAVTQYINSDSNGSKMNLNWAPINNGDNVIGAMFRGSAIKLPNADAAAYMAVNGAERVIHIRTTDITTVVPDITPLVIPNPDGGWSEAKLSDVTIQMYSRRP